MPGSIPPAPAVGLGAGELDAGFEVPAPLGRFAPPPADAAFGARSCFPQGQLTTWPAAESGMDRTFAQAGHLIFMIKTLWNNWMVEGDADDQARVYGVGRDEDQEPSAENLTNSAVKRHPTVRRSNRSL